MNLCRACEQDFSSAEAFDSHRVGRHAYTFDEGLLLDPPRADGRRCLSAEEMTGAGWVLDVHGRWVHPREIRKRLRRGGDTPSEAAIGPPATHRRFKGSEELSRPIPGGGGQP